MNTIAILIRDWTKIDAIRIDPVSSKKDCYSKTIEFVLLETNE